MDITTIKHFIITYKIPILYGIELYILAFIIMLLIYYDAYGIYKLKRQLVKHRNPFKKKVKKEKEITLKEVEQMERNINDMNGIVDNIIKSITYSNGFTNESRKRTLNKLLKVSKEITDFEDYVKIYHKKLIDYITINERPPLVADVNSNKEYQDTINVKNKPYDNSHRGLKKEPQDFGEGKENE